MDVFPPKKPKSPTDAALDAVDSEPSEFDPLGMYTGRASDGDEPQQDDDDL